VVWPSSVWSVPPVIVVEPLTPAVSDAVQVLVTLLAVNTSAPEVLMVWMSVELVTDPPAGVPWVLTVMGPEVKKMPGPYRASPEGTEAVTALAEPPGGNVTVGVGPRSAGGPPKRLILLKYP